MNTILLKILEILVATEYGIVLMMQFFDWIGTPGP